MCLSTGTILETPRVTEEIGYKFFHKNPEGGIESYYVYSNKPIPLGVWLKSEDFQARSAPTTGIKFSSQPGFYPLGFHFYKEAPGNYGFTHVLDQEVGYYQIRARNIIVDGYERESAVGVAQEILVEEEVVL